MSELPEAKSIQVRSGRIEGLAERYGVYSVGLEQVAIAGHQDVCGPRLLLYAVLAEDLNPTIEPPEGLNALKALFYVVIKAGDKVPWWKRLFRFRPGRLAIVASGAIDSMDWTDKTNRYAFCHYEDVMHTWNHHAFRATKEEQRRRNLDLELPRRGWLARALIRR